MSKVTNYEPDMFSVLRERIGRDVRKRIAHDMEESLVNEYLEKIRPEIKEIVYNITIESLLVTMSMEQLKDKFTITVEDKNDINQ